MLGPAAFVPNAELVRDAAESEVGQSLSPVKFKFPDGAAAKAAAAA